MSRKRRLESTALTLAVCSLIASFVWFCVVMLSFDIFRGPPSVGTQILLLGAAGLALVLGLAGVYIGIRERCGYCFCAFGTLTGAGLLLFTIRIIVVG